MAAGPVGAVVGPPPHFSTCLANASSLKVRPHVVHLHSDTLLKYWNILLLNSAHFTPSSSERSAPTCRLHGWHPCRMTVQCSGDPSKKFVGNELSKPAAHERVCLHTFYARGGGGKLAALQLCRGRWQWPPLLGWLQSFFLAPFVLNSRKWSVKRVLGRRSPAHTYTATFVCVLLSVLRNEYTCFMYIRSSL